MPGCSSRPVISASTTKRARLSWSAAVVVLDALQRHDAVELAVAGDVDLAEAAAVVEADDLEAALGVGRLGLPEPVERSPPGRPGHRRRPRG